MEGESVAKRGDHGIVLLIMEVLLIMDCFVDAV